MKFLLTITALLVLGVPTGAAAPPAGNDSKNPAKACKVERGTTTASVAAFNLKHGTNKNKKNALGKCVSKATKSG